MAKFKYSNNTSREITSIGDISKIDPLDILSGKLISWKNVPIDLQRGYLLTVFSQINYEYHMEPATEIAKRRTTAFQFIKSNCSPELIIQLCRIVEPAKPEMRENFRKIFQKMY